jgi:hypothetical protein
MSTVVEDFDIQEEKRKYLKFRRRLILKIICSFVFLIVWLQLTGAPNGFIAVFWYVFTPWGLPALLSAWVVFVLLKRWRKYHFRCPHADCDEAIYLVDEWVCPIDRSITELPFTLWYTIFTGCQRHNDQHPSPAHKCPTCGNVIKLLENARTGTKKFSYRPENTPATSLPPPQNDPLGQEYISRNGSPRERNFFE